MSKQNNIVKSLLKKADSGIISFSEKDNFNENSSWTPSGIPELDFNLGTLGYPAGLIEIAGRSRSGKTTLALEGLKNYQNTYEDAICFILSSENRDNREYAEKMGLDVENVIIIKSKYLEDLFYKFQIKLNEIDEYYEKEKIKTMPNIIVMWDSVGATLSRAEIEAFKENTKIVQENLEKGTKKELKHAQMGAFAKNAKMLMKAMLGQLYDRNITMIAINHTATDFQTGNRQSVGGEWKEYLPTLRLEVKLKEHIKLDDVEVGQITEVKVVKNDFGSRKKTMVEILLGVGIVLNEEDIEYAVQKGILKKEGAKKVSFMNGKLTWSTKRQFYDNYYTGNKFLPLLHKKITQLRHKDVLDSKSNNNEE